MSKPRHVGFDIEATGLEANFGHILCACFIDMTKSRSDVTTFRVDDPEFASAPGDDSKLVEAIRDYLNDSFIWYSWYGKRYDVRYINGRLTLNGLRPLEKRMHLDLYYQSKKMKFHSGRLDAVAQTFELKTQKDNLLPREWRLARLGDSDCMDHVVAHCVNDVKMLKEAHDILHPYVVNITR